jgi:two-component system, OmpR family, KDP operon response regulator KdpE
VAPRSRSPFRSMPESGPNGAPTNGGSKGRILVVDDEEYILRAVGRALDVRGYQVVTAVDGEDALTAFANVEPDLIVLDLNLPGMDGLIVCRRVRARSKVPILVLSAREDEVDKVAALDLGADDYLTKPFGIDELLARVRALLRRSTGQSMTRSFEAGDVRIDLEQRAVTRGGEQVHLTRTEWALLDALAEHPGKLLTQRCLLDRVWGSGYDDDVDVLRVFVSQLRRKIEPDPRRPQIVVTDPGVGYRWALRPGARGAEDAAHPPIRP